MGEMEGGRTSVTVAMLLTSALPNSLPVDSGGGFGAQQLPIDKIQQHVQHCADVTMHKFSCTITVVQATPALRSFNFCKRWCD